jgi:GT2 family glycosyltransferase
MTQSFPLREVIVVDNKSTDQTSRFLEEQAQGETLYPLRVIDMGSNQGGAGGFARGVEEAYSQGADLIWLMDDDCVPEPDALERLVSGFDDLKESLAGSQDKTSAPEPGFVCSNVRWKDGSACEMNIPKASTFWSRHYQPQRPYVGVASCSFVSVLVNARVIPLVGLPIREFFIWYEDVEFTSRVAKRWPGFLILDSLVVHEIPQNQGVHYRDVNAQNVWKYQYGIRNQASVFASGPFGIIQAARLIAQQVGQMSAGKVPLRLQARVVWAGLSGIAFHYRYKIRYPAPRGG